MTALAAATAMLAMAGCSALPVAGPMASDIDSQSGLQKGVAATDRYAMDGYIIVDVSPRVIAALAAAQITPGLPPGFATASPGAGAQIGVGDGITVSIWEAGAGGLFTSAPGNEFVPGARNVTIPEQIVSTAGEITIPYGGRVHADGLAPHDVEQLIQKRLTGQAIQPQVIVTVTRNMSNAVSITGEVTAGARVPLGPLRQHVLEVIASAGGIHIPANQAVIRILRNGKTASIPFMDMMEKPDLNIYMQAGDVVTVVLQPKTITAFGATARNAIVPFETVTLTLDEAIAKTGGLLDQQADPSGVFVFRFEPASLVARIAPELKLPDDAPRAEPVAAPRGGNPAVPALPADNPPAQPAAGSAADIPIPVVYRLDFDSVKSYFLARRFEMRDKDMIYVSNARLTQVQKFLGLINAIISPAVTGVTIHNAVK